MGYSSVNGSREVFSCKCITYKCMRMIPPPGGGLFLPLPRIRTSPPCRIYENSQWPTMVEGTAPSYDARHCGTERPSCAVMDEVGAIGEGPNRSGGTGRADGRGGAEAHFVLVSSG